MKSNALKNQSLLSQVVKTYILENLSFKIVSLFVALILWVSILGRRDFVTTKEIEVNFIVGSEYNIASQSHDRIKVKLSGSQPNLKKYKDFFKSIMFDLSDYKEGLIEIEIPHNKIDLPQGVKVLSIKPNVIKVELIKK